MLKRLARALSCAALLSLPLFSQHSGLDLTAIDKSVNPCDDFYQYACGNWRKANPLPPDKAVHGTFDQLVDRNQAQLRTILDDAAAHQSRGVTDQKIGGFYASCMNEPLIQQIGAKPLAEETRRIAAISDPAQIPAEVAHLHAQQIGVFFNFGAEPNPNDTRVMAATVAQGGLGLPEPGYYTRTDEKSVAIRQKYLVHIQRMLELAGIPKEDSAQRAQRVLDFETSLAKGSLSPESMRDPQNVNHLESLSDLEKLAPRFNWSVYLVGMNTPAFQQVNIAEPGFFKTFNGLLDSTSLADLRTYLLWQYVHASATLLSQPFVNENFSFYGTVLSGTEQQKPRWKRCVAASDDELGDLLGRVFVEKTFGEEGKERALRMVTAIESAMQQDLESATWMTPETRKQALIKLHAVVNKIGYPEKWRDYSTVIINPEDYFGNWYRANEYESQRDRNKIGKPSDKLEWAFTTPTVNAYYDPQENTINFPAGILQSPFFSNNADDAVNYGAIGMVIGHELTHAFDDEGRQFDASGNLRDWWQKADEQKFNQKASCLSKEASAYEPLPGLHVNGTLTLGENTADNGGVRLAYMALMNSLRNQTDKLEQRVDGYTSSQQFFLAEAQAWCQNIRPEQARMYIESDPHPPSEFRVNGVVSNMDQFQQAFGCKAGDKMYRADACRVW